MPAAARAPTRIVVAVHDVTPWTLPDVRWLLGRLDEAMVTRRVLMVVPGAGGAGAARDADLEALVRTEASAGSEMVLHGWTHRAEGAYRGPRLDRVRARLFANGAAEFLALDRDEMTERLRLGRAWISDRAGEPLGFCAPGWLWAPELAAAAREAGFEYLVGLRGLELLDRGGRIALAPVGYIGAGWLQELAWSVGEMVLWRPSLAIRGARVRRFFLHPQGATRSRACARVLREIGRVARTSLPATYRDLLDA